MRKDLAKCMVASLIAGTHLLRSGYSQEAVDGRSLAVAAKTLVQPSPTPLIQGENCCGQTACFLAFRAIPRLAGLRTMQPTSSDGESS
jgi:hypothetical protein